MCVRRDTEAIDGIRVWVARLTTASAERTYLYPPHERSGRLLHAHPLDTDCTDGGRQP